MKWALFLIGCGLGAAALFAPDCPRWAPLLAAWAVAGAVLFQVGENDHRRWMQVKRGEAR